MISFRAKKIRALVEPTIMPEDHLGSRRIQPHTVKFGERGELTVELLRSDVNKAPEIGEYIIDGDARRLRIAMVSRTPISWLCECATK